MGRRAESAREQGYVERMIGTAREGGLCWDDGRDCEGTEGCVERRAETASGEGCVGRMIGTAREGGLCGEDGRDCEGGMVVWGGLP